MRKLDLVGGAMGRRTRKSTLLNQAVVLSIMLLALSTVSNTHAQTIPGALPDAAAALSRGEWPAYAGTYAAARYSPLAQFDRTNARIYTSSAAGNLLIVPSKKAIRRLGRA